MAFDWVPFDEKGDVFDGWRGKCQPRDITPGLDTMVEMWKKQSYRWSPDVVRVRWLRNVPFDAVVQITGVTHSAKSAFFKVNVVGHSGGPMRIHAKTCMTVDEVFAIIKKCDVAKDGFILHKGQWKFRKHGTAIFLEHV